MATGSEDRMIKLWKASSFGHADDLSFHATTLSGHKDPIFALTGSQERSPDLIQGMLYSAGAAGVVKS